MSKAECTAESAADAGFVDQTFDSRTDWPTVRVDSVFEHPMSENRDLFNTRVRCPYCEQTHVHGPVYCVQGKAEDACVAELASLANCARGKYYIDQRDVQALID